MRLSLAAIALLLSVGAAAQTRYHVTDLGLGRAFGLNDLGQAVGFNDFHNATLWSGGAAKELASFGSVIDNGPFIYSEAYAINNDGRIVGSYASGGYLMGGGKAFLYANGTLSSLHPSGAFSSGAYGINASGLATGWVEPEPGLSYAATWANGDEPQYSSTYGFVSRAVNGAGQTAGRAPTGTSFGQPVQAYVDRGGTPFYLGTLSGDRFSEALAINASGRVAGYSFGDTTFNRGFVSNGNDLIDLGSLGGGETFAYGINDLGEVVGQSNFRAFVWSEGQMSDLNGLLDASSAGWELADARSINASGQIVGYGYYGFSEHAFLLTPVPEPASLAALGFGALGLLRRRKAVRA